jgi:hypothetical protein
MTTAIPDAEKLPLTEADHAYFATREIVREIYEGERGCFRATAKTSHKLGFKGADKNLSGLMLVIHGVGGRIGYELKPDVPALDAKGKPRKYILPPASAQLPMLDVLRPEKLSDAAFPLLITESIPKADAATTAWGDKLLAVGMVGVFGWRGQRANGAKLDLPCWESIARNRRSIFLVPDGNVKINRQVYAATMRLKAFLESREAVVHVVVLPNDLGLDDWLHSMRIAA